MKRLETIKEYENLQIFKREQTLPAKQTSDQNELEEEQSKKFGQVILQVENQFNKAAYKPVMAGKTYFLYLYTRNLLAFFEFLTFFLSLISFNLINHVAPNKQHDDIILGVMFSVSVLKFLSTITYVLSIHLYGYFLQALGKRSGNESFINSMSKFEKVSLLLKVILVFTHPIYMLKDTTSSLKENYFTQDYYYVQFQRDINDYFYIIQLSMNAILVFYILLENSYYAKTQCQRITKMFGVINDANFVIKCLLTKNGGFVSITFMLGTVFLFATLINVSEIGYVKQLKREQFQTQHEYEVAIQENSLLVYYYNTFWNILITMTTIGYGDIVVRTSVSRIIIFFCALSGAVILPLLVVTITKLFELPKNEKITLNIIQMTESKKKLQIQAARVLSILAKINHQKKRRKTIRSLHQNLLIQLKIFSNTKKKYESLYYMSELDDIENKIDRINFKFETLQKFFFDANFQKRDQESSLNNQQINNQSLDQ